MGESCGLFTIARTISLFVTTGSLAARRELKCASVLEVIRAARDTKAATLAPYGHPQEDVPEEADACRDALLSTVSGETPPKRQRAGRARLAKEKTAMP